MKTKTIALLLAVALVFGGVIGGTVAWLTDKTGEVVNTFTAAGIDITLEETPNTEEGTWTAQLVPGKKYDKDPVVAVVDTTDVEIYLFVKFEEKNDPSAYVTYTSTLTTANGWTQGDGTYIPDNVWYRTVAADAEERSWNLLKDDEVVVNDNLTSMPDTMPELVYTAYAIQTEGFANAAAAWAEICA